MHSPHRSSRLLGPGSNLKESDQLKGDVGGLGHKKEFKCRECPSLVFTSDEDFTEHLKVITLRSLLYTQRHPWTKSGTSSRFRGFTKTIGMSATSVANFSNWGEAYWCIRYCTISWFFNCKKVTISFYPPCRGSYTIPFLDRRARTGHFHAEFAIESSQTNIEGIIMKKDTVNLCLPVQK